MKSSFTTICLLFLGTSLASGQFAIRGTIIDSATRTSLTWAHVHIENTFLGTTSDVMGQFVLSNLKGGEYQLKVSFIGYEDYHQHIILSADTSLQIPLVEKSFLQEEVIIESTRISPGMPGTYQNISKETLQKINLGKDMPFLLGSTPSMTTTSDAGNDIGYTGLRIRGTDPTRINVTINGIPYNDPESHSVYWVDVPDMGSSVDNVQIQRGVGTSTNGAASFGASINLQTQKLEPEPYARIENSYGSFNSWKNKIAVGSGLIAQRITFDARFSHISSDGYIDRASSSLKSFYLSGGYFGKKSLLKVNVISGDEKTYHAWEGVPGDSLGTNRTYNPAGEYLDDDGKIQYYDNQIDKYRQDHYQLLFSRQVSKTLIVNSALFYVKGKGYYENYKTDQGLEDYGEDILIGDTGIYSSDLVNQKWLDNHFYGITFSTIYSPGKKYQLTGGGAYNRYDGDHYGYMIWARNALVPDPSQPWYENTGEKSDLNVYLKGDYILGKSLNVFGDLQYRNILYTVKGIDDNLQPVDLDVSFNFINPKFGINYKISANHKAYGFMGIANREPNRQNYLDADPGKEPTYERLYDYELGYSYQSENLSLGMNIYYMDYHNQLVLTGEINNVGDAIMVNVPSSYRTGIEMSAAARILQRIKWDANLTLSRNKIDDYTEFVDNWDTWSQESTYLGVSDISFSPGLILNNTIAYEPLDELIVSLISKYVGKQYIDNSSSESRKLDSYFVNHLVINYTVHTSVIPEIGFDLMVNNLFNASYITNGWVYRYISGGNERMMNGFFPQATINFMAGLRLNF